MRAQRTGAPVATPVTLADARLHCRAISTVAEDAYLTTLIEVATRAAEDRMQRSVIHTPWRLTLDRFPEAILLPYGPIASVQAVTFTDPDGNSANLDQQDYVVDAASDPGFIVPKPGRSWPTVGQGINQVQVSYTAGFGSTSEQVPAPIRHWILLAIAEMYDNRAASSDKPALPQLFADRLLDPYRVLGI